MYSLEQLEQLGHDITSAKYYFISLATLLLYDYFLTLQDEVRHVWKAKKTWVFWIFFLNRYPPMLYMVWCGVSNFSWSYDLELCARTGFIKVLFLVWSTLIAQTIIIARVHAITMQNKIVTVFFVCTTITQFSLGIYMTTLVAYGLAREPPPVPLTAYRLCVTARHWDWEVVYTGISLCHDILAFLVVVYFIKSGIPKDFRMSHLLQTVLRDTTIYFMVIFTSHLVLELTLLFAKPSLQLLPSIGNNVYLPVMISRLMLSLRKAAATGAQWQLSRMSYTSRPECELEFAPMPDDDSASSTQEDIPLTPTLPTISTDPALIRCCTLH